MTHFTCCTRRMLATCMLATSTVLALPAPAHAVDARTAREAQARFREEMAVCTSGRSPQGRATCIEEARHALAAARRGALGETPRDMRANVLQRCGAHTGPDREACEARMSGRGRTEGSVAGGGLMREITTDQPSK